MKRIGCISFPLLPLQILLKARPAWREAPVAVVASERPEARLVQVNRRAAALKLRVGMTQSAARQLVPHVHTAVVPEHEVEAFAVELGRALHTFSPRVERDRYFPETFFIDPQGLDKLYGGLRNWTRAVHGYLRGRGLYASTVVGFSRYRALAIARARAGFWVIPDRETERDRSDVVPLYKLGLPPMLIDGLSLLGLDTLGAFLSIPAGELAARFGREASHMHGLFAESPQLPMQPRVLEETLEVAFEVDPPDADPYRLLFGIKGGLAELIAALEARHQKLKTLFVRLMLERGGTHEERIEPAEPTREVMTLLELVRLRLQEVRLDAPVEEVKLSADHVAQTSEQQALLDRPARDIAPADRAIARLRAAFGPQSVTRARLRPGHLPEARFQWEPLRQVPQRRAGAHHSATSNRSMTSNHSATSSAQSFALVRRMMIPPRSLGSTLAQENVRRLFGPYRISGGWWCNASTTRSRTVLRDYYYAETALGAVLWLYFDRARKRWYQQGAID